MKTILLIGAGKSSTILIEFLLRETAGRNWKFIIADADANTARAKTGDNPAAEIVELDIYNDQEREAVISRAHVVISMMPPHLHFLVAKDCVELRKHLLTASYLDEKMKSLRDEIHHRKLLFLCEMGLDPGIDHMSAMQIIEGIQAQGGTITSFRSHCGGLVAPESDDNPWHYKVSWNPKNIVTAGSSGAIFREDGETKKLDYQQLFDADNVVNVQGLPPLAFYPNRDSLGYINTYRLRHVRNFIRTTLRYPIFFEGWNAIVKAGLTDDSTTVDTSGLDFFHWSQPVNHFTTESNMPLLQYLGLFEKKPVPPSAKTSADILQFLLETKLAMRPADKDMIVMLHEIEYEMGGRKMFVNSELLVEGQDSLHTAMAKTVGLPLGIAAILLLEDELSLRGLHIPIKKEIYEPVLAGLKQHGISFTENTGEI